MAVTFFILILVSCKDATDDVAGGNQDSLITGQPANTVISSGKNCYAYFNGKDTVTLTVQQAGNNNVEGRLVFRLREKDVNTGELKGKIENGLLVGYYTFQSEGMTSVREEV